MLITDDELERAVDHIAKQGKPSYEKEIHEQLKRPASGADGGFNSGGNIGVAGPNDDEDLGESNSGFGELLFFCAEGAYRLLELFRYH